ncbi:MAG TPA: caspase family protein [Fibrobacteria bacterium]|nr:caspase family protein [Fibrobacteria bacterium]
MKALVKALAGLLPLLLLGALPAPSMVRMAVVIGNNSGLEDDKPLQFATRDAEQVHDAMMQLGGIDKGRDHLLLNPDVEKVMRVFEEARRRIVVLRSQGQKVQLLIYYSGHGSDEALHLNGEKLPLSRIREFFKEMEADLKILIADACFSGSLIQPKGARLIDAVPVQYHDELKVNGSAILTSSSAGEFSQESKELQGSLFTHYFLTAIRGAGDADHDGMVSLWEAYNYTQAGLRHKLASVRNVSQNPEFDVDLHGSENVVLTRVNMGQAFLALRGVPDGRYQILESVNALQVAEVNITDADGTMLALPKAPYLVYRSAGGQRGIAGYADLRRDRSVELGPGDFTVMPLGALIAKGMDYRDGSGRDGFVQIAMTPRFYPGFPGRDIPALALDFSVQGNWGKWATSFALDYLPAYVGISDGGRFEQEGLGLAAEARYYWSYSRTLGFFAGPRLEAWSLSQKFNGEDLGRGNLYGTLECLGAEKYLTRTLSFSLSVDPGLFWSVSAAGGLRQEPVVPVTFSFRYGI